MYFSKYASAVPYGLIIIGTSELNQKLSNGHTIVDMLSKTGAVIKQLLKFCCTSQKNVQ